MQNTAEPPNTSADIGRFDSTENLKFHAKRRPQVSSTTLFYNYRSLFWLHSLQNAGMRILASLGTTNNN